MVILSKNIFFARSTRWWDFRSPAQPVPLLGSLLVIGTWGYFTSFCRNGTLLDNAPKRGSTMTGQSSSPLEDEIATPLRGSFQRKIHCMCNNSFCGNGPISTLIVMTLLKETPLHRWCGNGSKLKRALKWHAWTQTGSMPRAEQSKAIFCCGDHWGRIGQPCDG